MNSIMTDSKQPPKREYPKLYEKTVPIFLGILVILILAMLIYTIGVAVGLFTAI
jgi:hypothetical protein